MYLKAGYGASYLYLTVHRFGLPNKRICLVCIALKRTLCTARQSSTIPGSIYFSDLGSPHLCLFGCACLVVSVVCKLPQFVWNMQVLQDLRAERKCAAYFLIGVHSIIENAISKPESEKNGLQFPEVKEIQ